MSADREQRPYKAEHDMPPSSHPVTHPIQSRDDASDYTYRYTENTATIRPVAARDVSTLVAYNTIKQGLKASQNRSGVW